MFSLPDANIIVPGRNYTALVDLGREDERGVILAMAYSVTGLTCARRGSINRSTGLEGVVGFESCTKHKQIALSYYCL